MSGKLRVVTDSTATFDDANFAEDFHVTVVPLQVHFGERVYREGIDIRPEEVLARTRQTGENFRVTAPPIEIFQQTYQELSETTDEIIVLVNSQRMTRTFDHAQSARAALLGRCDIAVIDSMTTSLGLGYISQIVAEAADSGASLDDAVRIARGVVPRLYSVYYVETLTAIQRAGLIGETQAILGTMLNIKPLLTVEDGGLIAMEKARSHSQAVDKMVEFAGEFTQIERVGILQNSLRTNDRTRMLQDRLALEFSRLDYSVTVYEPLLASYLGPDAMGIAILEGLDEF